MPKDRRERPWKKLRVVVEVTVPPTSRATESDLRYLIERQLDETVKLRRPEHANAFEAPIRLKLFTQFWPWFLRKERGLSIKDIRKQKKESRNDPYNGL